MFKKKKISQGLRSLLLMAACVILLIPGAVTVQAKTAVISQKTAYMAKGDTLQLKMKNTTKKVTWSTSNKKVAAISSKGKVTAKKVGKATITARIAGNKVGTCKITVEKKTVNRARKLRNYVLNYGKYDSDSKRYYIEKYKGTKYEKNTFRIYASKKNKIMSFYSLKSQDSFSYSSEVKINLISGSSATKKGSWSGSHVDSDEPSEKTFKGKITTAFTDMGKGFSLTYAAENDDPVSGGSDSIHKITDKDLLDEYTIDWVGDIDTLFKDLNGWMKTIKKLNKYGITMNTIGFSKLG